MDLIEVTSIQMLVPSHHLWTSETKIKLRIVFHLMVFFSQVAAIWTPRSSSDELFVKMGKTKRRTKKVRLPLTIYLCIFWCEVRLQCTYIGCKTLNPTKVILSKTHCSSETCGVLSKYLHWLQNLGTNQWNNFKNYFIMLKIQA